MKRTQIKEGYYWIDRLHFGMTIGRVSYNGLVTFPGSIERYRIGMRDASNVIKVEPRRFLAKIEEYAAPVRVEKESWE